jgi:hypothetical protein
MRFTIIETRAETAKAKKSHNAARARRRAENPASERYKNVPTEFVCVDGEGITLPDGTHKYVLLGVGDQYLKNPDGLGFDECLEFLWSQFRTGSVAYTGFFLGYDFIQILKNLPEERARMLLTTEGRAKRAAKNPRRIMPFPVRYNGWEFDILGGKRLKIRREGSPRWMHICDTGPFFQKSFLNVINPDNWAEPIVTPQEYAIITRGKAERARATLGDDMIAYNRLESQVLARVLSKLNEGFQELGIHLRPSQWFGPGQAASAWLKGRAITRELLREVTPPEVLEAARASYYGGWFEITAHGTIPGTTWEYDINSAYPHIISQLPCLEHGTWERDTDISYGYTLIRAKVTGNNRYLGTMLHRDTHGNISRPWRTEGWYWETELHAAKKAKLIKTIEEHESWTYIPCNCPPPLREVKDIYAKRQEVGKKTPLGIACKLVPNSLYGKFAQSVGSPEYGNAIYASLITSGCRTMILDAISTHPNGAKDVLMVATDGIYFKTHHPNLPLTGNLGDFEEGQKENISLFKPGVYWDDKARHAVARGEAPVFKARGVHAASFAKALADADTQFTRLYQLRPWRTLDSTGLHAAWIEHWPTVTFTLDFSLITGLQALQRSNWGLAGTLESEPKALQSSNPILKRWSWYWGADELLRSKPPPNNDPCQASIPYAKRFGIEDPFSDLNTEGKGIHPDGLPGIQWKEGLYG